MKLIHIKELEVALKNEKASNIKLFHNLIFDTHGDRNNRKRLREFEGFSFNVDSNEFQQKVLDVKKKFSLSDLIIICNILSIDNTGTFDDLNVRILLNLCDLTVLKSNIQYETDSEIEDEDSQIYSNKTENNSPITENVVIKNVENSTNVNLQNNSSSEIQQLPVHISCQDVSHKPSFNYSDIENLIVPFDGSELQSVRNWLNNFEDIGNLLNLTDLQKLIFGKRSLTGKAKLFMQSESNINSFDKFKELLIHEFGTVCNSAEIHIMLFKRKRRENESLEEYFLIMKQLCSRGNIENSALMQYVINGINDSVERKSVLYGCKDLAEFKMKLKIYEKICLDSDRMKISKSKFDFKSKSKHASFEHRSSSVLRCFNCGQSNHKSVDCRNKDKGPRCFRCSLFGHKSFECPKAKLTPNSEQTSVNIIRSENLMLKNVKLCSLGLISLFDTGSQKTLLKKSIYDKIKDLVRLELTDTCLTGLGKTSIRPYGYFRAIIEIDDSEFETDIFVISDCSVNFDLIIGMDVIHQGTLTVSSNVVTLSKNTSSPDNFLVHVVNVLDDSEIDLNHVSDKRLRSELRSMIKNYSPNRVKTVDVKMKINLTDEIPVCSPPRRLPPVEKKIVEKQIEEWLDKGIIRKSSSDFSSPIVLVKKKDSSTRICIDYRRLNKKTVREHFPLPVIDDVLDKLNSAKVFTTLDLKNGFFHVDVEENSRKYTSFVTHEGQYEFLKCPFGLTNSPSVFQRYIYNVFRPLLKDNIVVIYMDDLLIPAENEAEGIEKLKLVLKTASEYGLELNLKKCDFLKREITFLGYRIENGNLHPSPLKTKAVVNFPEPKCAKDVQSYLGLTSYFRKFIKNYSIIAKPLSDLLKKNVKFHFGDQERHSFNKLKQILSSEPVLSLYNPRAETEIHCDACIDGLGAVLIQKSIVDNKFHPVHYMSKKTTEAERKYSSYELEVMAVVEALKKFRIYVLGIPFKIVTDCNAFKMTMSKKDVCTKIARWALMLSDYDYTIEHRHGSSMRHVDALSRNPICMIINDSVTHKIIRAQETDEHIKAIKEILKSKPYDDYLVKADVLYKCVNGNDLLVVPEEMQMNIIKTAHEKGHFAVKRTQENLNSEFYIPSVKQKIEKCISNCVPCILINRKLGKQEGLLHPIDKEKTPLHTYHIDHLGPLESTHKNYKYILAVIDAFTKFVWLYPTKSTDSAEVIAKLEIQKAVFGNPSRIISDKGSAFTSKDFVSYCAQESIQNIQITTGLPRANGQVERLNSIIIPVLAKLSVENPAKWYTHVGQVQQVINSTFQRSINTTPFELLFGTKMKCKNDVNIVHLLNEELQAHFVDNRDDLRNEAKKQILKVQKENCKSYNLRRRKPHQFQLNDIVAIKRTQHGPGLKLKSKYLGPYKVTKVKPNDTYNVQKIGFFDGPLHTSTCAEYMKPWPDET